MNNGSGGMFAEEAKGVLRRALVLLGGGKGLARGAIAIAEDGRRLRDPLAPDAARWDAPSLLVRAAKDVDASDDALREAQESVKAAITGCSTLRNWSLLELGDHRSAAHVKAAFEAALAGDPMEEPAKPKKEKEKVEK